MKLLLASVAISVFAPQDLKPSPYYPLKLGTTWEYKVTPDSSKPESFQAICRVTKLEKYGEVMCALVQTTKDGVVASFEYITTMDDGIYRFSVTGVKMDPPVCFFKLPPKKGESWVNEYKAGGETMKQTFTAGAEEVEVPLGKYKTATTETSDLVGNGQPLNLAMTCYYAEGVGMVKQIIRAGGRETVLELTKFAAGK